MVFIRAAGIMMIPDGLHARPADTARVVFRDFDFVKRRMPCLSSANAAGLTTFSGSDISVAEIAVEHGQGGLVDFNGSPHTFRVEGSTESFCRLNSRSVVYGRIGYCNFTGRHMGGSAFIDPHRMPFDLVEDSLTNLGRKHLDRYDLVGGVGIEVWRGASIGMRLSYTSANYAKYKDLRHKNSLMNLEFTLGAMVPVGRRVRVGGNYYYRRKTESLRFSTYGKTEKTYQTLVAYAAFMGKREQFGGDGYVDDNLEIPFYDEYGGGGVQVLWQAGSWSFFNSLMVGKRHGYYGRRSPHTITYTNHHGKVCHYEGVLTLSRESSLHQFVASVDAERLENAANTYRELRNDAGSAYYRYYDAVKTADKIWVEGKAAYTACLGVTDDLPTWTFTAGVSFMHRRQTGYAYPYFRRQRIGNVEACVGTSRNVAVGRGMLEVGMRLAYLRGYGHACEDGTFATPSDKQTPPPAMQVYLFREYERLTAAQYQVEGGVKYSFLMPGTSLPVYLQTHIAHRRATGYHNHLEGNTHTAVRLAMGCTF